MSRAGRVGAAALVALTVTALPVHGQATFGVGAEYMGYTFEEGLGASAAQLLLVPVAVRIPFGSFAFDVYSAWAQGKVERDDLAYTLEGPVDTRVKLSYQATPWALLSVGANVPTGNSTHDGEEAVVASVLAMDLLGFQEATWGTGAQVTSSLATAMRAGAFGIGIAAAYAVNGEFEPIADQALRYQPGNEARVRVGIDRNFGSSTFTAGATFMSYAQDQADGRNLFQAGNRMRFDASLTFRAGGQVWTLYGADLWREHGDLTLPFIDDQGAITGDTTIVTPSQNLIVGGLAGSIAFGSQIFRPQLDIRIQTREEVDGREEGSGWLASAGGDLPLRIAGVAFIPKGQFHFGQILDPIGAWREVMGATVGATLRFGF